MERKLILFFALIFSRDVMAINLEEAINNFKMENQEFQSLSLSLKQSSRKAKEERAKRMKGLGIGLTPTVSKYEKDPSSQSMVKGVLNWKLFSLNGQAEAYYSKGNKIPYSFGIGANVKDFYYSAADNSVEEADIDQKIEYNNLLHRQRLAIMEVIELYLEIKSYEGERIIKERNITELNRELKNIEMKFSAGLASELDRKQMEYEIKRINGTLANINKILSIKKERLAGMIGPFSLLENVEDVTFDGIRVDETRFKNALLTLEKMEKEYKLQKISSYPSLSVSAGLSHENIGKEDQSDWRKKFSGAFSIEWDIFNDKSALKKQEELVEHQKLEIEQVKKDMDYDFRERQREYEELERSIEIKKESVLFLRDVVNSKKEAYHGKITSLMDYMKYLNELQNEEVELLRLQNEFNGKKRIMQLIEEDSQS